MLLLFFFFFPTTMFFLCYVLIFFVHKLNVLKSEVMQLQNAYLISQKLCRALTSLIAIMYCNSVIKILKIILIDYLLWGTNNWTRACLNYTLRAMSLQDNLLQLLDRPIPLHSLTHSFATPSFSNTEKKKPPQPYENFRDAHAPHIFKNIKNPKQTKTKEQNSNSPLSYII